MENKENECFPSISDETLDKIATKYVPENTEKMTKWAVTAFQDWRGAHNAQRTDVKHPNDLLVKCEAGPLNKWLSRLIAEARHGGGKLIHILSLFTRYIPELIKNLVYMRIILCRLPNEVVNINCLVHNGKMMGLLPPACQPTVLVYCCLCRVDEHGGEETPQ